MAIVLFLILALTSCTPTKNDYLRSLITSQDTSPILAKTEDIIIESVPGTVLPQIIIQRPNFKIFSLTSFDDLQLKHPLSAIRISPDKTRLAALFGEGDQSVIGIVNQENNSTIIFPYIYDLTWKDPTTLLLSLREKEQNSLVEFNPTTNNRTIIKTAPKEKLILLPTKQVKDPNIKPETPDDIEKNIINIQTRDKYNIQLTQFYKSKDVNGPILLNIYGAYNKKMSDEVSEYDYPYLEYGSTIIFADIRSSINNDKSFTTYDLEDVIDYLSLLKRKIIIRTRSAGALPVLQVLKSKKNLISGAILEAPLMYLSDTDKYFISWDTSEWGEKESHAANKNLKFYSPNIGNIKLPPIFVWASKADSIIPYDAVLNWISQTNSSKVFLVSDDFAPHEGPHMEDNLRDLKAMEFEFAMSVSK